jgi:hypothetical protein
MATIDTLRPDAGAPRTMDDTGPAAGAAPVAALGGGTVVPPAAPDLAAFRAERSEADRTADLLAFAIATERGLGAAPDAVERARREADAALGDYSLRYLHNNIERIRQEAVAEHLGRLRPPPGFPRLVAANLVALAVAGAAAGWLWTRPEVRTAFAGLLGG